MALNLETFKEDLFTSLDRVNAENNKPGVGKDAALRNLANAFAEQIDKYIKTATVSTTVTGTCETPSGAGTIQGSGSGSLS